MRINRNTTILAPLAPAKAVFCFPSELSIPEGPEYVKKYQHYIDALCTLQIKSKRHFGENRGQRMKYLHLIFTFTETNRGLPNPISLLQSL